MIPGTTRSCVLRIVSFSRQVPFACIRVPSRMYQANVPDLSKLTSVLNCKVCPRASPSGSSFCTIRVVTDQKNTSPRNKRALLRPVHLSRRLLHLTPLPKRLRARTRETGSLWMTLRMTEYWTASTIGVVTHGFVSSIIDRYVTRTIPQKRQLGTTLDNGGLLHRSQSWAIVDRGMSYRIQRTYSMLPAGTYMCELVPHYDMCARRITDQYRPTCAFYRKRQA